MHLTTFKTIKKGNVFFVPDAVKGTNEMHKFLKTSSKEALAVGYVVLQEFRSLTPVYAMGTGWKKVG